MKRSGLLTEIIKIYRPSVMQDDWGNQATTDELVTTTRARVVFNNGSRNLENQEVVYDYTKIFTTRFYVDVKDFDKVFWQGNFYRVTTVERNSVLQETYIHTQRVND